MALILTTWLNSQVKLSQQITPDTVDGQFSSGYMFAELLSLRGVPLPDLKLFIADRSTDETAIHNFSLLEPVFASINVPINSTLAFDIIRRQSGAAVRTIYAIRSALFTLGGSDTLTGAMVVNRQALLSEQRKHFQQKEHDFFVGQLKRKLSVGNQQRSRSSSPTREHTSHPKVSAAEVAALKQHSLDAQRELHGESKVQTWRRETEATEKAIRARTQSPAKQDSAEVYREKIRVEHEEVDIKRLEQQQRRARFLQDELNANRNAEAATYKKLMAESSNLHSKQEQRIIDQWQHAKNEKLDIIARSVEQQAEYDMLREDQYEEALRRDHDMADALRAEYHQRLELFTDCFQQIQSQHSITRRLKHESMCRDIVKNLVTYACQIGGYQDALGSTCPIWKCEEFHTLFMSGYPLDRMNAPKTAVDSVCESMSLISISIKGNAPLEIQEATGIDLLDDSVFEKYLKFDYPWNLMESPPAVNSELAKIVDLLLNYKFEESVKVLRKPDGRGLKMVVLGKPLSGVDSLKQRLAEIYEVPIITPSSAMSWLQRYAALYYLRSFLV